MGYVAHQENQANLLEFNDVKPFEGGTEKEASRSIGGACSFVHDWNKMYKDTKLRREPDTDLQNSCLQKLA